MSGARCLLVSHTANRVSKLRAVLIDGGFRLTYPRRRSRARPCDNLAAGHPTAKRAYGLRRRYPGRYPKPARGIGVS
jgi:hypothetical protein